MVSGSCDHAGEAIRRTEPATRARVRLSMIDLTPMRHRLRSGDRLRTALCEKRRGESTPSRVAVTASLRSFRVLIFVFGCKALVHSVIAPAPLLSVGHYH